MTCVTLAAMAAILVADPALVTGQGTGQPTITVPAISFTGQGGNAISRDEPKNVKAASAPGFIHFWYTPGHWLEWTVDGVPAGDYEVTVRYATRFSVKRNLTVNGRTVAGLESFALKPTGIDRLKDGWDQYAEAKLPAAVPLAAGRNVLRMTCLDDQSVCVRELVLSAAGKPPVTIPAGQFTGQGGGRVQVITPPVLGTVGNKWAESWKDAGQWLEWTVEAPKAGRYALGLHYRADGYCRLELQVNGAAPQGLADFILPKTGSGSYFTVGTLPTAVTLREGKNTLRVTSLGGPATGVPRFDGMFGLSAIHLTVLSDGASLGDNVLALATMDEIKKAAETLKPRNVPPPPLGPPLPAVQGAVALKAGESFALGQGRATIVTADVLPYVENQFTKGGVWENYDNPMLKELREIGKLEEVVARGKDEYEKQILLMTWVWEQWDHGHAQELYNLREPAWILREAKREHIFQCMHSGSTLASVMASMGYVCRAAGHSTHTWNEVWSNQHRRWMMFDPTSNLRYERNGLPLSTYEVYHMRYVELADNITAFSGAPGNKYQAKPGAGKTAKVSIYGTNAYVDGRVTGPRARLEIGKDLTNSFDPKDAYYPIHQAALALAAEGDAVKVTIGTLTPNFKEFRVRLDGGEWKTTEPTFTWPVKAGKNRLEAMSVNRFGIEGPVSTVVLDVAGK
jgi:hypothetical protein